MLPIRGDFVGRTHATGPHALWMDQTGDLHSVMCLIVRALQSIYLGEIVLRLSLDARYECMNAHVAGMSRHSRHQEFLSDLHKSPLFAWVVLHNHESSLIILAC